MSADLGIPILVFILGFWAIFAVSAVMTTFIRRENLRKLKASFRRLLDTRYSDQEHA